MSRLARTAAAATAAAALLVAAPGAASAAPPEKEHYSGTDSFDEELCGIEVHFEIEFSGHTITRRVPGSDQAFLGHQSYEFRETISVESGAYVTTRGKGTFKELRARLVEGTIYEFDSIDAGGFTMWDADGRRVFRGNGVAKSTILFDTLGDGVPGGEFLEEISFDFRGHETGDFCEALLAELG